MMPAPDPGGTGAGFACVLAADPLSVRAGLALMFSKAPLSLLAPDHRTTAEVVLAEVLNNIVEHAYAERQGSISVTMRRTGAGLECLVTDEGNPMPGGQLPAGKHPAQREGFPDLRLGDMQLGDLPEGGFGWYLIRRLTRDLKYSRHGQQNRLGFVVPI
jgi:serine/threonine-protein kinase RsbW